MKLDKKVEYLKQHVASIMGHTEEPLSVRLAAMSHVVGFIEAEKKKAEQAEQDKAKVLVDKLTGKKDKKSADR